MNAAWQDKFDAGSAARGQDYYERSMVKSVEAIGGELAARVAGSRPMPYTVAIDPDEPLEAWCTCPVEYRCKHIYATILTALDPAFPDTLLRARLIGGLENDSPFDFGPVDEDDAGHEHSVIAGPPHEIHGYLPPMDEGPYAPQPPGLRLVRTDEAGEQIIDLLSEPGNEFSAFRAKHGIDSRMPKWVDADAETGTAASHRLVLLVGSGGAGYGWGSGKPLVYPARQYLRKDGLWGRIERIKPGAPTLVSSARARRLAEKLLIQGGSGLLILYAVDLEESGAPVFLGDPGRLSGVHDDPVTIIRPRKAVVALIPRLSPGHSHHDVELDVHLALDSADGRFDVTPGGKMSFDSGLGMSVALFGDGTLVMDTAGGFLDVIHQCRSYDGTISRNRVSELVSGLGRLDDRVELRAPTKIRIVTRYLEPRLVFSSDYNRYSAMLVLEFQAPETEPDGMQGEEYVLHCYLAGETDTVVADISGVVGPVARRDYYSDRIIWRLGIDSVAFALEYGAGLLELGYPVMIRDIGGDIRRLRRSPAPPRIRISSGVDWFDLHVTIDEEHELDWATLDELIENGSFTTADSIVILDEQQIERLRAAVGLVDDAVGGRIRKQNVGAVSAIAELADEVDPDVESIHAFAASLLNPSAPAQASIPAGLTGTLRHYQDSGFQWLARLASHGLSGCLADDMGLGKTIQALAFMLHLRAGVSGPFLVIAPVSTLGNWRSEAHRFAPALSVVVHHGPERATEADRLADADLVVTSYATAVGDGEMLMATEWGLVCLDEAQFIKNPRTKTSGLVRRLPSNLRLCLTGTPVENSSTDLWSIIDFLIPGLLGPLAQFTRRFPRIRGNASEKTIAKLQLLRRITAPFVLRRTKAAVAPELPPRIDTYLHCTMTGVQARFYNTLREYHRLRVKEAIDSGKTAKIGAAIFTGLLRLRQAAFYPEDAADKGKGVASAKETELLQNLLEVTAEGNKALVFSQFVTALKRLEQRFAAAGIRTLRLDGSTRNRTEVIETFQTFDGPIVFLISLRAGGTGINLTAADYVFVCDPWWNPAVEQQAIDRAHRIGRDRPVFVYRVITEGTVEHKVMELQEQKRRLAADLIAEDADGLAANLADASAEELLTLFE